jgi:hypothetical protein
MRRVDYLPFAAAPYRKDRASRDYATLGREGGSARLSNAPAHNMR